MVENGGNLLVIRGELKLRRKGGDEKGEYKNEGPGCYSLGKKQFWQPLPLVNYLMSSLSSDKSEI